MKCTCDSHVLEKHGCSCSSGIHRKLFTYGLVVLVILLTYLMATTFNGRTLSDTESASEKVAKGTASFAESMTATPTYSVERTE